MTKVEDLYQETILEHGQNPRNFGKLKGASSQAEESNPVCGDRCRVYLRVNSGVIKRISFELEGCLISKASASLMTQALQGKTLKEAQKMFELFQKMIRNELSSFRQMGKLAVFSGISRFPQRVKCALLPWYAVKKMLSVR